MISTENVPGTMIYQRRTACLYIAGGGQKEVQPNPDYFSSLSEYVIYQ